MADEPTESISLTLDESGMLCHLLMAEIVKMEKPAKVKSAIFTPEVTKAVCERASRLYLKLAAANDKLMGK